MLSVKVINKLRTYRIRFRAWRSTRLMYTFCKLYAIKLGRGCRFWKRTIFYTEVGAKIEIGNNCVSRSDFDSNLIGTNHRCIISTHTGDAKISIGNGCAFSGVSIGAKKSIEIGDNVMVGVNSLITDFDWHSFDAEDRDNKNKMIARDVIIENNVWIGANSTVLKGVHIGKNTIIGSGSVVVCNMPENAICGGNPCKILRLME